MVSLEGKIKALKNELKAQKQFSQLSWGQLASPESVPRVTITDTIDITTPLSSTCVAKYVATFARADGKLTAPLVDFAYEFAIQPTGIETEIANGATITADSLRSLYEGTESYISAADDDSVEFTILFPKSSFLGLTEDFNAVFGTTNVNLTLTVEAISPVMGALAVERSYDV